MKRWIIRSFFIGLLLLCVGGWGLSYVYDDFFGYEYAPTGSWYMQCGGGKFMFVYEDYISTPRPTGYWFVGHQTHFRNELYGGSKGGRMLGFRVSWEFLPFFSFWHAEIPFWFLSTILAVLLWLAWRWTRPKAQGRAFPVELEEPEAKP